MSRVRTATETAPPDALRSTGHVGFPPRSRFLMLPRRPRRATRAGLALYEGVEPKQRFVAHAGRLLAGLGLAGLLPGTDRTEVDWSWWTGYVRDVVEPVVGAVTALAFRIPENPRISALAFDASGRPVAFAKLLDASEPEVPAHAGRLLSAGRPTRFRVPSRIAEGVFNGHSHRLLEPLPEGLHSPPPRDPARLGAIVDEMQALLADLSRPPGTPAEWVACHADLTPRNLRVAADGEWWLFDWDNVRWGPRLADELRYWCAALAYSRRPRVGRDARRILELLRARGTDDEIRAAVAWPDRVRQTYRDIEVRLLGAIGRLVGQEAPR